MAEDMPWYNAIIKVLKEAGTAMHYKEIAEEIVSQGLRSNVGTTPATSVSVSLNASLKQDGEKTPFRRVARGEYRSVTKQCHEHSAEYSV